MSKRIIFNCSSDFMSIENIIEFTKKLSGVAVRVPDKMMIICEGEIVRYN